MELQKALGCLHTRDFGLFWEEGMGRVCHHAQDSADGTECWSVHVQPGGKPGQSLGTLATVHPSTKLCPTVQSFESQAHPFATLNALQRCVQVPEGYALSPGRCPCGFPRLTTRRGWDSEIVFA